MIEIHKAETKKEINKKEEIHKEIEFWLPGYSFFKDDAYLRERVKKNPPERTYNEYTRNMEDSFFALYGDGLRLSSSVALK